MAEFGGDTMRNEIKDTIKTVLDNVPNLKAVYTFKPKFQSEFPAVVISLTQSNETRISASAPFGKKKVTYVAQLEIFTVDTTPDGSGQLTFDQLLDDVDTALRVDPTFGGAVLAAGVEYIKTVVAPPQMVNGQNIALLSVKTFDVTDYVTG